VLLPRVNSIFHINLKINGMEKTWDSCLHYRGVKTICHIFRKKKKIICHQRIFMSYISLLLINLKIYSNCCDGAGNIWSLHKWLFIRVW
jgi:hypothetical protein